MSESNKVLTVLDRALASDAKRDRVGDAITELEQALNTLVPGASARITERNRVQRIAALSAAIAAASKAKPAVVSVLPSSTTPSKPAPVSTPAPAPRLSIVQQAVQAANASWKEEGHRRKSGQPKPEQERDHQSEISSAWSRKFIKQPNDNE